MSPVYRLGLVGPLPDGPNCGIQVDRLIEGGVEPGRIPIQGENWSLALLEMGLRRGDTLVAHTRSLISNDPAERNRFLRRVRRHGVKVEFLS